MTQFSVAVWQPLVENDDLAAISLKVRKGETLTEVETIRYEAYAWLRLEQIWSMYDLHRGGVIPESEWQQNSLGTFSAQTRAAQDSIFARVISEEPMPPDSKAALLTRVQMGR